jgi:hypothetical protein
MTRVTLPSNITFSVIARREENHIVIAFIARVHRLTFLNILTQALDAAIDPLF